MAGGWGYIPLTSTNRSCVWTNFKLEHGIVVGGDLTVLYFYVINFSQFKMLNIGYETAASHIFRMFLIFHPKLGVHYCEQTRADIAENHG